MQEFGRQVLAQRGDVPHARGLTRLDEERASVADQRHSIRRVGKFFKRQKILQPAVVLLHPQIRRPLLFSYLSGSDPVPDFGEQRLAQAEEIEDFDYREERRSQVCLHRVLQYHRRRALDRVPDEL